MILSACTVVNGYAHTLHPGKLPVFHLKYTITSLFAHGYKANFAVIPILFAIGSYCHYTRCQAFLFYGL